MTALSHSTLVLRKNIKSDTLYDPICIENTEATVREIVKPDDNRCRSRNWNCPVHIRTHGRPKSRTVAAVSPINKEPVVQSRLAMESPLANRENRSFGRHC